ncbi:hypothetical protein LY78DRAFT_325308 [Colletotrichum sublineola]|nr:hypothetical protein LY78DRAFT_325308 [Colletotrichum sublineola]
MPILSQAAFRTALRSLLTISTRLKGIRPEVLAILTNRDLVRFNQKPGVRQHRAAVQVGRQPGRGVERDAPGRVLVGRVRRGDARVRAQHARGRARWTGSDTSCMVCGRERAWASSKTSTRSSWRATTRRCGPTRSGASRGRRASEGAFLSLPLSPLPWGDREGWETVRMACGEIFIGSLMQGRLHFDSLSFELR